MPSEAAARLAYVTGHVADRTASAVMEHTTRALGPGPMTQDQPVSQLLCDLALYVRQSHAERDLATLGRLVARDAKASG